MVYTVPHYIGGKSLLETTTNSHTIYNPANGEAIGQVYFADKALCDKTVAIAKEAWPSWAETAPVKRARILFKFRELLEKYLPDIAKLVTR